MLLPIMAVASALRSIPIYKYAYPSGTDYGLQLFYAELIQASGKIPAILPYFQLGIPKSTFLPGGPFVFILFSGLSGAPIFFGTIALVILFGAIEVSGSYLLARRIFRRTDAALVVSFIVALSPSYVNMMSWSGYPNIIAIGLVPLVFLTWLDYWDQPNGRRLLVAVLVLCGTASIHHLTTLWIAITLGLFVSFNLVAQPVRTARKLIPFAVATLVIGFPIILSTTDLALTSNFTNVLTQANRFDVTRLNWETWARVLSPVSILLLSGGLLTFALLRTVRVTNRVIILAYAAVSLFFAFGWLIGLKFYYSRAIFFLALPMAFGAAALYCQLRRALLSILLVAVIIVSLGGAAIVEANRSTDDFKVLTPAVMEAVDWLTQFSGPEDVIVMGTYYGFQLPRLLRRPVLVAMSPELVSDSQDLFLADGATSIMMGLYNMNNMIDTWHVRYILVKNSQPDIPDPLRSLSVMTSIRRLKLVFQNSDVTIFEVRPA